MANIRILLPVICAYMLILIISTPVFASLRISEFMAANTNGLDDQDNDEEDWIEIHNNGTEAVNLKGWYLSDKADNLKKWAFPELTLDPNLYMIVFASGKDLRDPNQPLHTNFKLKSAGEYLGLIHPDGHSIVTEFTPRYPIQAPDVSYGFSGNYASITLIAPGAPAKALIPTDGHGAISTGRGGSSLSWTSIGWDDHDWYHGITGVGFDYPGLIGLDVSDMLGKNPSVYVRVAFEVTQPEHIQSLTLRLRFEDGMVAYINGQEVARHNAPTTTSWSSQALKNRTNPIAYVPVDFDVDPETLAAGTNILAIQGLNEGKSSSRLLVLPELLATEDFQTTETLQYFPIPTPARPNNQGINILGPTIKNPQHSPHVIETQPNLVITAEIEATFAALQQVQLSYQVMFDQEITVPMHPQGQGHYQASISTQVAQPGQMIRWYITAIDQAGHVSRYPRHADPLNSPEYLGTIVNDPCIVTALPVLHRFIEFPHLADTELGTPCSLFFEGVFYDNVNINQHGQSSLEFPKKSHDVDFHPGHNFKWAPNQPRADDINLLSTYADKAHMRTVLSYETFRMAGCPSHWAYVARIQENGAFWGTVHMVENGDEDWLIRMGVNAQGALYKMYNRMKDPDDAYHGAEKKTRKHENNEDLLALEKGVSLSGEAKRRFVYDHLNFPQIINFLATMVVTGNKDCCHKNYYLYRDTGKSDEWQMWPWDVDLSFGRQWGGLSKTYWDQKMYANTTARVGSGNNDISRVIYDIAELEQMYYRRLRTLMDELLRPEGTPQIEMVFEPLIDQLAAQIGNDAALDALKWGSNAWGNGSTSPCCAQTLSEAVDDIKYVYLPERRYQLYNRRAPGAGEIPDTQIPEPQLAFGPLGNDPNIPVKEQFIQIYNPYSWAVDVSLWTLHLQSQVHKILFTLAPGTVIPAGGSLYVAADRKAFRARTTYPNGNNGLLVVGDFTGALPADNDRLLLMNGTREAASMSVSEIPAVPDDSDTGRR